MHGLTAITVAALAVAVVLLFSAVVSFGRLSWAAYRQSRRTRLRLDELSELSGRQTPPTALPLVSVIMTTRDHADRLTLAIGSYGQQTYPNKELIIVDSGGRTPVSRELAEAAGARLHTLEGATLGALLNAGAGAARGTLCQYVDGAAWYGPRFLETMVAAWQEERQSGTAPVATVLMPFLFFDPATAEIVQPPERAAPSATLLFERSAWEAHPFSSVSPAADLEFLADHGVRGGSTVAARAVEAHVAVRNEAAVDLRNAVWQAQAGIGHPGFSPDLPLWWRRPEMVLPDWAHRVLEIYRPQRVLILTPVKDAASCIDRYCELVTRLSHRHDLLSLGFLESDSVDGTYEAIGRRLPELRAEFRRVELWKRDFGYRLPSDVPRWEPSIQPARRTILAKSRNELLFRALQDEDWVLWIDADVIDYPPDLIERLLETGKDIVQPHCVYEPGGRTFDLNGWRDHGRLHLEDLRQEADLVHLDAVGGTVLLVRAAAHREGLIFPAFAYGVPSSRVRGPAGEIETEGLGIMAHDLGYECWGMPNFEVIHKRA